MSYFFTNPQAKKWKKLFVLSALINVVLITSIIATFFESPDTIVSEALKKESKAPIKPETIAKKSKQKKQSQVVGDPIHIELEINSSFYAAFANDQRIAEYAEKLKKPHLADLLGAHLSRPLIWYIELRKDVRNGDKLNFIFKAISEKEKRLRKDLPDEIEILAASYYSQKFSKSIQVYRYKKDNETFDKFYDENGTMVEKLLTNSPVREYIEITSHLNDRRPKHDGMDFKMPVGSPVYASTNGTVRRTNWATKYNGYCIEISVSGKSHTTKFLHLKEVLVKRGQKVKIGDLIAKSGNTGRSTAPHLHYQVNRGVKGKVLNPLHFHKTITKTLKGNDLKKFKKLTNKFDQILNKNI